jgi:ATP-dependent Lon protease
METVAAAVPTRGLVVYPGILTILAVGRAGSKAAIERHLEAGAPLVLVPQRDPDVEDPNQGELSSVGVLGNVLRVASLPDGNLRVLVEGIERVRLVGGLVDSDGVTTAKVETLVAPKEDPIAVHARARQAAAMLGEFMISTGVQPTDQVILQPDSTNPERVADHVASVIEVSLAEKIAILEEPAVGRRLVLALDHLVIHTARQRLANEMSEKVQEAMDKSQREYHLREQLKQLRVELGEAAGPEAEADVFAKKIEEAQIPEPARTEAMREVDRLRRLHSDSAEYTISRTWLETICDFPWNKASVDDTDLGHAQQVLDEDHYGLEKVKERVLEYLAVRRLKADSKGPILAFVGPPGVGKTSLGRSIARALGRQYVRVALGGMKDESEVRGHRRTYVGAMPGRITRALIRAGTNNPVLVLDELDKVGKDFRGDPAAALLEVLDPEQNGAFVDHYVDVAVDLSQVLFIATANLEDPIPSALLDRLEVIDIPGYTEEDKLRIARRFLLPKLAENHGLKADQVEITDEALTTTIREYTREAGLRDLERQLAGLHRKIARKVVENNAPHVKIDVADLVSYLGPQKHFQEVVERADLPGIAIGLAWTAAGGDILFIECSKMPGKRSLKLTGHLGDVMKESAEAALSWLRTNAPVIGLEAEGFEQELHLHVPAGAIPKDGPSAGVTMVTALASTLTGRTVVPRLAMTGEITLRGKVLPVGGVKEKVLAARRAGVTQVILPEKNRHDLDEIPEELRRDLTFHFVENVKQVLELALEPKVVVDPQPVVAPAPVA